MDLTKTVVTLRSTAPYSQSRKHDEPHLDRESSDAYEKRTWKLKMHVRTVDKGKKSERKTVVIPAPGMHQSIADAAKYLRRQIPGKGTSTWTKHFQSGIAILQDLDLHIDPASVRCQAINAHVSGVRGSGKRVTRFFPTFDEWEATFEVLILDPIITEDIFTEVLQAAGLFKGVGQFRPENLGTNGRWEVVRVVWEDNRQTVKLTKQAA